MACPSFGCFSASRGASRNNSLTFLFTAGSRRATDKPIMDTRDLFAPHASDPSLPRIEMDNRVEAPTSQPVQRPAPRSMSGHTLPILSWSSSDRRGLNTLPQSRHAYGMTWHQTVQVGSARRPTSPIASTPARRAELPPDGSPPGVAARTERAGLVNATHSRSYPFRPNPQDAALLQNLSARLAAYCDSLDGKKQLKKNVIEKHVRNLKGLSEWLTEQAEQNLTNVLVRLEAGQLSELDRQQLLNRYQAKPVGGRHAQGDASSIGASVQWLQKLRTWECERALDGIVLPGVATGPVPAAIDTQVKHELVAAWLATQSSTRTDKEVLQQTPNLWPNYKTALKSLARWILNKYKQKDKLDCIAKHAGPDIINLITEHYKSSAGDFSKDKSRIDGAIKRLRSKGKITIRRNLDAQLHVNDKLAINIIKQHSFTVFDITVFKQFAILERGRSRPVGLAQIIANPAHQTHCERMLAEFNDDESIKPGYKNYVSYLMKKAQRNDELKQALSKLQF